MNTDKEFQKFKSQFDELLTVKKEFELRQIATQSALVKLLIDKGIIHQEELDFYYSKALKQMLPLEKKEK